MNIVTGGGGFIGSHLVDALLDAGRKVLVLDRRDDYQNLENNLKNPNLQIQKCDLSYDELDFSGADTVFHLAAMADIVPSITNPVEYFHSNVTGTLNALEAAKKAGVKKFIYTASASCYGMGQYDEMNPYGKLYSFTPSAESFPKLPQYPYALTKYLGEQLVMHWGRVYGMTVTSLRLFNVYGMRSRTNGSYGAMFGTFLAQIANGKPITIVGDGNQSRDFVHVSDVITAIMSAASSNTGDIFNVGSGRATTINDIADMLGAKERVYIPKRPGEPDITRADIGKIQKALGWEPMISMGEGIQELLDNIHLYKDAPVWDHNSIAEQTKEWFRRLA